MNFMEHIKGIDKRIEMRKEQEYQMTLFSDSGAEISGASMVSTRPNIFGGQDIMDNGMRVGYTQPNIFGGQNYMHNGMQVGYSQPNIFGGQDYHSF